MAEAAAALRATVVRTVALAAVIPAEAAGTSAAVVAADTPAVAVVVVDTRVAAVDTPAAEAVIARAGAARGLQGWTHEIEARPVDVNEVKNVRGGKGVLNGTPFLTAEGFKVPEF